MTTANFINFKHAHPRRNLPANVSRRRGESNFVAAFTAAYVGSKVPQGFGGTEFALQGYGIADFIWLAWQKPSPNENEGNAMSLETLKSKLSKKKLTAFEMKMRDWRKGLAQAYRYSYFADVAILVLPEDTSSAAQKNLRTFRDLRVGLWSFDKSTGKIRKHFTPRAAKPRNATAREKAVETLSRQLIGKFRKLHKQTDTLA